MKRILMSLCILGFLLGAQTNNAYAAICDCDAPPECGPSRPSHCPLQILPTNKKEAEVIVCYLSRHHFVTIENLREGDALLRLYQGPSLLARNIVSSTPSTSGITYQSAFGPDPGMMIDMSLGGRGIQFNFNSASGRCL